MPLFVDLTTIRDAIATHVPQLVPWEEFPAHSRAAVALLLRETSAGPEILYILRAEYEGDPWSGNIAFPGGHVEPDDPTERHTAQRETFEELGIDLSAAEYLGRLDDVFGAHLPVIVACFVWVVPENTVIRHNGEVVKAFWINISTIVDPVRQLNHYVNFRGEILIRPAIDLLGPDKTTLWGITYRLTSHFFSLIGITIPHTPIP